MSIDFFSKTKGILNLGNTCFFNSFMQLFLRCNDIIVFIINYNIPNGINIEKKSKIKNLKQFIRLYFDDTISPNNEILTDLVVKIANSIGFEIGAQQDAMEFFGFFLDFYDLIFEDKLKPFYKVDEKITMQRTTRKGNLNEKVDPKPTEKTMPSSYLNLPFKDKYYIKNPKYSNDKLNLQDLLNDYCMKSIFPVTEQLPNENGKYIYSNEIEIICSKYLFINLRREGLELNKNGKRVIGGTYKDNRGKIHENPIKFKIENEVTIPDTLTIPKNNKKYNLIGFYVHSGSESGGHYYAYKKYDDRWYKFNDSSKEGPDLKEEDFQLNKFQAKTLLYEEIPSESGGGGSIAKQISVTQNITIPVDGIIKKIDSFYDIIIKDLSGIGTIQILFELCYYKKLLECIKDKIPNYGIVIDLTINNRTNFINILKQKLGIK